MKNTLKVFYVMLFVMLFVISNVGVSKADPIPYPDNDFIDDHYDECEFIEKECIVNNDTNLYESPLSVTVVGKEEKSKKIFISCVYKDSNGSKWGFNEKSNGWIDMGMVIIVYDSEMFIYDFKDKVVRKVSKEECKSGTIIWKFPFSEEQIGVVNEDNSEIITHYSYTDDKKREWVLAFYNSREAWICLDDCSNSEIYKERPSEIEEVLEKTKGVQKSTQSEKQSKKDKDSVIVYIVITSAIVIIIGITLVFIKKKWKNK